MEWPQRTRIVSHFVLLMTVLTVGSSANATPIEVHLASSDCSLCHAATGNITQDTAHLLTATQEELCGSCHENSLHVGHRSGFTPERPLPGQFPLDWKGSLTCSSCHSIHATNGNLLRTNLVGQTLCRSCHKNAFFQRMADEGLSIIEVHLTLQPLTPEMPLDTYSLHCGSCHDDVISLKTDNSFNAAADGGMDHSIGLDYTGFASRDRYYGIGELDERMLLPHRHVSCVTCHQGYSRRHGELNVANVGSALCYQCHNI